MLALDAVIVPFGHEQEINGAERRGGGALTGSLSIDRNILYDPRARRSRLLFTSGGRSAQPQPM
jgi:hypothetical protein